MNVTCAQNKENVKLVIDEKFSSPNFAFGQLNMRCETLMGIFQMGKAMLLFSVSVQFQVCSLTVNFR